MTEPSKEAMAAADAVWIWIAGNASDRLDRLMFNYEVARRIDDAVAAERERIAQALQKEADACMGDIVQGDEQGRKLMNAMASALLTAAMDVRRHPPMTEARRKATAP